MTAVFLLILLGATERRTPVGFAPIGGAMLGAILDRPLLTEV